VDEKDLLIGPVLSFRGIGPDGSWRVTALVGLKEAAKIPVFKVDGRPCGKPRELLVFGGDRYLRYDLSCKINKQERTVSYGVEDGLQWRMTIPGQGDAPRMAYVSCNGFSDPAVMRKLIRKSDAVWEDLLYSHDRELRLRQGEGATKLLDKEQLWHEQRIHDLGLQRFHLLLMGGDQIYFDSMWEEIPQMKEWVALPRAEQLTFKVSAALERRIEAYYFTLYKKRWLPKERAAWSAQKPSLDAAAAMACVPTIMMWDDHDIFDGWGSYSCEMQQSPLFQILFKHARRAFWLFQMQHAVADLPELEDVTPPGFSMQDPMLKPIAWSAVLAKDPAALPLLDKQPGFTSVYSVGPVSLIAADLRTERSRTQILSEPTWGAIKNWLTTVHGAKRGAKPAHSCKHLLFMSSVPVVHPKLSLAELFLDNFGQDHVTDSSADDLKDHWAHDDHDGERKRLLEVLTTAAKEQYVRVSLVSGDVHVAAWGTAYRKDLPAIETWSQIHQFTASAVVHPSLMGVMERLFLGWLNTSARNPQTIDVQYVAEMMTFPSHDRPIMAARNWLALEVDSGDDQGRKLWGTWRCETETGFSNHLVAVPSIVV